MTLRVTVEIIPFGDEDKARTIDTLNINNITWREGCSPNGEDQYIVERNSYKNYNENTPRIFHHRKDGALALIKKACELFK
jgi:hypothetical protein